ncbi:MAG: alpha/beta hydrolase family protein [Armatimonadota bacterium]
MSPSTIPQRADLTFAGANNTITLSPRQGGRVISWTHRGSDELVFPLQNLEGGLLRVMFAEERYPGASYVTPHLVMEHEQTASGFRVRLRHFWNTTNALLRLMGWPEKVNPLYLDGLLLDKTLTFDDAHSLFTIELAITNLSGQRKIFTPWLHSAFSAWTNDCFVVEDGRKAKYENRHIYWGSHTLGGVGQARLVQTGDGLSHVLGASADMLAGLASYWPPEINQGCTELRYAQARLGPGECWRASAFLAVAEDWQTWATDAPCALSAGIEPAGETDFDPASLLPLLAEWALPEERERGLMTCSFLDKGPFTSLSRFAPADLFGGFRGCGDGARSSVKLFALRDLPGVTAELQAGEGWRLCDHTASTLALQAGTLTDLSLHGPADLAGRDAVSVKLLDGGKELATLTVPADAAVEPAYPYAVKQYSTYLEERFRDLHGPFTGTTKEELDVWLGRLRERHWKWLRDNISGECEIAPRLVERQVGDTCVRDKVLVQTEPGLWMPAYVIYPKDKPATMPAIIFTPGSGPGKMDMAPDDRVADYQVAGDRVNGMDYAYLPYRLAVEMNCLLFVPDQRGWGEQAETNLPQMRARCSLLGVNYHAQRMWDHIRYVDYLCSRPDVDATRIGCFGGSGGGLATIYAAGIDQRIAAAIVSSSPQALPHVPEDFFYNMWEDGSAGVHPNPELPAPSAFTCAITIPRPLWIIDGVRDECVADPRDPRAPEIWARWHQQADLARAEIARLYRIAGIPERFEATWFDGTHCGGMNFGNVSGWFKRWFK